MSGKSQLAIFILVLSAVMDLNSAASNSTASDRAIGLLGVVQTAADFVTSALGSIVGMAKRNARYPTNSRIPDLNDVSWEIREQRNIQVPTNNY